MNTACNSVSSYPLNSSPQHSQGHNSCKRRTLHHGESSSSVAGVSMASISSSLGEVVVWETDWLLNLKTAGGCSGAHGLRKLGLLSSLCWGRHFGLYVLSMEIATLKEV